MSAAEQLSFGGMPQRLYPCTPTRLTSWLDCPRRYRMTYLDRPPPRKGPPWAHNSLGASVHNALAGWWRLPRPARSVTAAGDLLQAGWIGQGFADEQQSARQRSRARAMVESYVATLDPADEPLGVERTVAARTDRIAVSGRIDRLDERPAGVDEHAADAGQWRADAGQRPADMGGPPAGAGGPPAGAGGPPAGAGGPPAGAGRPAAPPHRATELIVVDYKTGRHLLTTDDARSSLALALYAVAAARSLRRPCHRVELHHLPTGSVLGWEHTDATLARQIRRAEEIAAECDAADTACRSGLPPAELDEMFPPRPGPGCGWCDYRQHCPQGSAASPARRPWDGISDEPGR